MIDRRDQIAPTIVAIRNRLYEQARDECWPLADLTAAVRRKIADFAADLRAAGHGDWADFVLRTYGEG